MRLDEETKGKVAEEESQHVRTKEGLGKEKQPFANYFFGCCWTDIAVTVGSVLKPEWNGLDQATKK